MQLGVDWERLKVQHFGGGPWLGFPFFVQSNYEVILGSWLVWFIISVLANCWIITGFGFIWLCVLYIGLRLVGLVKKIGRRASGSHNSVSVLQWLYINLFDGILYAVSAALIYKRFEPPFASLLLRRGGTHSPCWC